MTFLTSWPMLLGYVGILIGLVVLVCCYIAAQRRPICPSCEDNMRVQKDEEGAPVCSSHGPIAAVSAQQ